MEDYKRFVKINEEYYEINRSTLNFLYDMFKQNKLVRLPLLDQNKEWFGYDIVFHKKTNNFYFNESKEWYIS